MDRSSGLADEIPEDRLGQARSGLAVAGGVGRDGGQAAIVSELLESIDGVVGGMVVGEDLREEDAQGDPRGLKPLTPEVASIAADGLDAGAGEMIEEGQAGAITERIELARGSRADRLRHGDLLGVGRGGCEEPPDYQPRGSPSRVISPGDLKIYERVGYA